MQAELQSHIEMRMEDNLRAGMSPEEARRDALLRFGNATVTKERVASMDLALVLEGLWRDLRYSCRQLRRRPGFALTATITLALGIGANVVVFSVLNALLLRPLPVPESQQLFNVQYKQHGRHYQSYPDYLDYRDRNSTFSGLIAYDMTTAALRTGNTTRKSFGYLASGNYFDVLEVKPVLGRFFHAYDEHGTNSAPYVVLSYEFWQSRFQSDARIIGQVIDLNQHPFTVIGVAPKEFHGVELLYWPDFWIPMVNAPQLGYSIHYLENRSTHNPWILGRLKLGVTPQQANENLNAIASQLAIQYPHSDDGLNARLVKPGLLGDSWGDPIRGFLAGIMALALLVLLAACANLGSIFATRAAERSRELAIRLAIGSSRWKILRELLTEAVVISVIGGFAGTLLASGLLYALSGWHPFFDSPIRLLVAPDVKVFGVALLLSLSSGIFFGLLPLKQLRLSDATHAVKGEISSSRPGVWRLSLQDLLLGLQVAVCTLLVTASFVALRGMERSFRAPVGFHPEGVTLAATDLSMAGYNQTQFFSVQKRLVEEASRLPGVSAAGAVDRTILNDCCGAQSVYRPGTTVFSTANEALTAYNFSITPGYLQAAGTHLVSGRDLTWHDDANAPEVVLVNETFARRMFGRVSVVGEHFLLHGATTPKEIVGVVEDGKYKTLTENPSPAMFFPLSQEIMNNETLLVVRSSLPSGELSAPLVHVLEGVDPRIPYVLRSWSDALDLALFPARAAAAILSMMGLLAAMLAVTGIFGMATYGVSRRMKEFGIRVALGAARTQLMSSALGRTFVLILLGLAAGLVSGVLSSHLLAQVVYQATALDPIVLGGVILCMALLGFVATCIPARRALSIDPARLLRDE